MQLYGTERPIKFTENLVFWQNEGEAWIAYPADQQVLMKALFEENKEGQFPQNRDDEMHKLIQELKIDRRCASVHLVRFVHF